MKALLVITARQIGGAELYVERLVKALTGQCAFTIALAGHPNLNDLRARLAEHASLRILDFDRPTALPGVVLALRRLAAAHKVVHLNSNHPASRLGILCGFALAGGPAPLVCVEHRATPVADVRVPAWLAPILPALFRWSRRGAARVVAVSRDNAACLIDHYRLPAGKIEIIHNGAEPASPQPEARETLRQELGLRAEQPLILTLARLAANKGHRYLIEAAPAVRARYPGARFVFAGASDDGGAVTRQVEAAGLMPHFNLLGQRADVGALLAAADVFVLPSLAEGFALSLIDALAAGLPAVATAVGGAADVIRPGENGWLVPPADAQSLAEAVNAALALTPSERERWQRAARETAARFSTRAMADKVLDLYRRVRQEAGNRP